MSVGHVARALEEAGISTVIICCDAFGDTIRNLGVPRALLTPHMMGRPIGMPNDRERQTAVLRTALDLLANATAPCDVREFQPVTLPKRQ